MNSWLTAVDIGILQGLLYVPAVLGFAIAFRFLRFPDLTVEASLMLGGAAYAIARTVGMADGWAILLAACAGAGSGLATGAIHRCLHVNKILSGILAIAIAYTVGLRVMHGSNVSLIGVQGPLDHLDRWNRIGPSGSHFATIGALLAVAAVLVFIISVVLQGSAGIRLRAVGSNPDHAQALGLRLTLVTLLTLAAANALTAVSGAMLASNQGFADVSMGQGSLVLVLASVAIGERCVAWLSARDTLTIPIAGVAGAILYELALSLAVRAGLPATDLRAATAIIVLLFVMRSKSVRDAFEDRL